MACGGLCQVGSGGDCDSCKHAAAAKAIQTALYTAQSGAPVLGGIFGRTAWNLPSRGIGQLVPINRGVAIRPVRNGPPHHRRRGLGQAAGVVDVNPADYVNLGFDQTTATSMAQLDNNFNNGAVTQASYVTQAQAIMATIAPTTTVDENAADYQGLGWSQAASQAAANAATDFNAGTTNAGQYASAMQGAVGQMFAGGTVAPSAAQVSAGVTPSSTGLTGAQQAAVDQAAIQGATSVLNTGIAGAVAASKGQQLTTTSTNTPTTPTVSSPLAGLTKNQKIGLGVAGVVVVLGVGWVAMSGGRRRRRRR